MKFKKLLKYAWILLLLCHNYGKSQISYLGNYPIINYSYDDFKSPVQIYSCLQFKDGSLIFGNPENLINFNGVNWSFIRTDTSQLDTDISTDNTFVYSLYESKSGKYYGAREQIFGEIKFNSLGRPIFSPIYTGSHLSNMWGIHENDSGEIFFHTREELYCYKPNKNKVKKVELPKEITAGKLQTIIPSNNGSIYSISYREDTLYRNKFGNDRYFIKSSKNNSFIDIAFPSYFEGGNIVGVFNLDDVEYVISENNGIFPLLKDKNEVHYITTENNVFKNAPKNPVKVEIRGDLVYIATETNGVIVFNTRGEKLTAYTDRNGLQDNNIHDFLFDEIGNLWLCLDNGISVIELPSPTAHWKQEHGVVGGIESIEILDDNILLLSRTKGILNSYLKNDKIYFSSKTLMNEAAYDLEIANTNKGKRKLVVGYSGIFEISEDYSTSNKILDAVYGWKLYQTPGKKDTVYVGGEDFFGRMYMNQEKWVFEEAEEQADEIRSIVGKDEYIYFGVKGKGIYKWAENKNSELIDIEVDNIRKNSPFFLEIFKDNLFVGYDNGILILKDDKLKPVNLVGADFNRGYFHFHRLFTDQSGDKMWAIIFFESADQQNSITGYFTADEFNNLHWNEVKDPFLEGGIINDMKQINNLLLFGSNKGLVLFDHEKYKKTQKAWGINIHEINIDDTISYGNNEFGDFKVKMNYGQFIRFKFSPKIFQNGGINEYKTRIVGYSNDWSSFEKIPFKDFEKIPHGTYTLEVQGRNAYGKESEISRLTFVVSPPWYLSTYAYVVYVFIIIIIILISVRISTYRVQQKNKLLEKLITERTNEIAQQNELLEKQKNEIESKKEDILDSIKYAKRIQDTILPTSERLDQLIGEHFVFFQPKDIVSGDFYWARKINGKAIVSAIDCTGHGVPGALVSFVGNNALLRVTNEFGLSKPSDILDKLKELVTKAFKHQGDSKVKDGMDMALIAYDKENALVEYAGAHNSLYLIRNEALNEYKADKQPIGYFEKYKPFTNHEIKAQKGDCIYLFSDGFVDQFGGLNPESRNSGGKKYKSKNFKELLLKIHKKPMQQQKETLMEEFFKWKGDLEQLDDVCVIGMRI